MTVIHQSEFKNVDGFQIDWDQFLIPYRPGCYLVEELLYGLKDACEAEDKQTICLIILFMLVANNLYVPPQKFAYRCDPSEVESLIPSLRCEAHNGEEEKLQEVLIHAAVASGVYGTRVFSTEEG